MKGLMWGLLAMRGTRSAITDMRRKFNFRPRNRNDAVGNPRERGRTLPLNAVY